MALLTLGVLLWSVVHLFPALAPYKRKKLIVKTGILPYKLGFALLIVSSLVLIVLGWRSATPQQLYLLPEWVNYLTLLLVLCGIMLFVAARVNTNIKRVLRHPQLTGLVFWATGHLLANGDSRSLLLFLGLLVWAKVQIVATNKRDGKRSLPAPAPRRNDVLVVVGGIAVYLALVFAHPYLSGVTIL